MLGVSNITSNLTGFSGYMEKILQDPSSNGIYIVDRKNRSYEDSIKQLADYMFQFCELTRKERIELRNKTQRLSDLLSWNLLHQHCKKNCLLFVTDWCLDNKARRMALDKVYPPSS